MGRGGIRRSVGHLAEVAMKDRLLLTGVIGTIVEFIPLRWIKFELSD